jgi:membrane protease YdiL (CAAX protease family)
MAGPPDILRAMLDGPFRLGPLRGPALQIVGLLGTNHLLSRLVELLPGFAQSRAHDAFDAASDASQQELLLLLLRDGLGAAVVEELLFRGLLFEALRRWLGPLPAIFGSALLFGAIHLDWHQGGVAVLLGLQLGAMRHVFGLPTAIAAHATNNLVAHLAAQAGFSAGWTSLGLAAFATGSAYAALAQAWRRRGQAERSLQTRGGSVE